MFLRTWLLRRFLIVPVICMGPMTLGACAAARSAAPSVTISTTETVVITPSPPPSSALPTPAAPNPTSGPALQTAKSNTTPAAPASVAPEVFVMPRFSGQMDDYQDALYLTTEVDACRHDKGSDCNGLADRLASERNMDPAIASIAKMEEMIVLCHSPVAADDHEACGTARLPSDVSSEECTAAYAAASARS